MSSDETDPQHGREESDDNPGPLPFWRIRPTPEIFARVVESCRKRPDWSREALEEMVLALRIKIDPEADVEAAIKQFRALAEQYLPKEH